MQQSFISVASEGGGAHALDAMSRAAPTLARAVRRSIPFLGRRSIVVAASEPELSSTNDVAKGLGGPAYVSRLAVEPGGARAYLAFDADAIAFLMDGSLCGDGKKTKKIPARGLSPSQKAFIEQTSAVLVGEVSATLESQLGLKLSMLPPTPKGESTSGAIVSLTFSFEGAAAEVVEEEADDDEFLFDDEEEEAGDDAPTAEPPACLGKMVVAISKSALMAARPRTAKLGKDVDDRVAATMAEVPVDVVAVLGRLFMSLGELGALRVGDTLRVPVAVNGAIDVCVDDLPLFKGRPTTTGSQLAIQLIDHPREPTALASGEAESESEPTAPKAPNEPRPPTPSVHVQA